MNNLIKTILALGVVLFGCLAIAFVFNLLTVDELKSTAARLVVSLGIFGLTGSVLYLLMGRK